MLLRHVHSKHLAAQSRHIPLEAQTSDPRYVSSPTVLAADLIRHLGNLRRLGANETKVLEIQGSECTGLSDRKAQFCRVTHGWQLTQGMHCMEAWTDHLFLSFSISVRELFLEWVMAFPSLRAL